MSLLSTRGLSKSFGGLQAIRDVDFELPEGQVRALIGPNGAGKSTFVGAVCGRIPASGGSVRFAGTDVTRLPAHKRICLGIAYTFQITSVFAGLPVRENVALGVRRALGAEGAEAGKAVDHALERVGLYEHSDRLAGDLSYGHQRLLEIAMGLGQRPKLFVLDEPTQGLSESEVEEFNGLIRSLSGETTILLIEHNMRVVMEIADYITVLNNGRTLAEGAPEEVRSNRAVQDAYLGTA